MTKSTKTHTQAVQILGAALALGMSLGMLPNTAASAEEMKNQRTQKWPGDPTMKNQHIQMKLEGDSTVKHQQTNKLQGDSMLKNQNTIKFHNQ